MFCECAGRRKAAHQEGSEGPHPDDADTEFAWDGGQSIIRDHKSILKAVNVLGQVNYSTGKVVWNDIVSVDEFHIVYEPGSELVGGVREEPNDR